MMVSPWKLVILIASPSFFKDGTVQFLINVNTILAAGFDRPKKKTTSNIPLIVTLSN
jgi:hypothetical protein